MKNFEKRVITRSDAIRENMNLLKRVEPFAMRYFFEPKWEDIKPAIRQVNNKKDIELYRYARFIISSEPQSRLGGMGKRRDYIIYDKNSGAILGIGGYKNIRSFPNMMIEKMGIVKTGIKVGRKQPKANNYVQLSRCLPIGPFGKLLGGKLLALMLTSKEIVKDLELYYTAPTMGAVIKTLHGKSSQYNRLDKNNITYIGDYGYEGIIFGHYWCRFRKGDVGFLSDEISFNKTKLVCKSLENQIEHWKERWFLPRLKKMREEGNMPKFNRLDYSITKQLSGK